MDALLVGSLIKLGMSVLVGGLIGAEREFRVKAAGFRTIILITVGSTLFTIFSITIDPDHNRTGIAGNIVQGIGFLGAGASEIRVRPGKPSKCRRLFETNGRS